MRERAPYILFLILLTSLILYFPALKNPFIWDDFYLVVKEDSIRTLANIPTIFKTHLFQTANSSNFYRPIQSVSFMLDYRIWKLNPFGYHLTNILLHLLNVVLVYFFVKRLFRNSRCGSLAAMIFAIHPVNTEAVTYIAGRADPLCTAFFLSAFLFYMKFKDGFRKKWLSLSVAAFAVSLLTKESAIIFPLILIFYDAVVLKENAVDKSGLKRYFWYFAVFSAYIFWRFFFLGLPAGFIDHPPAKLWLLTTPKILFLYLKLLIFPVGLHMERIEDPVRSLFGAQALVPMTLLVAAFFILRIFYRRSRPLFFCAGFFFITLLPMLNILSINAIMAEHWLYLPSVGIYAIASFACVKVLNAGANSAKIRLFKNAFVFCLTGFLCFFSVGTVIRNIEWGRPYEFYAGLVKASPDSARAHLSLGAYYISVKNLKLAREELLESQRLNPASPLCCHNIGFLDYAQGNKTKAVEEWKKALDMSPFFQPTIKIMNMYLRCDYRRFQRLSRAVYEHPHSAMALYRFSKVYYRHCLYLESIANLEIARKIDPDFSDAVFNIAWCYSKLGLYQKAISEYDNARALTPDDPDIYRNMTYCYVALKDGKAAALSRKRYEELIKAVKAVGKPPEQR